MRCAAIRSSMAIDRKHLLRVISVKQLARIRRCYQNERVFNQDDTRYFFATIQPIRCWDAEHCSMLISSHPREFGSQTFGSFPSGAHLATLSWAGTGRGQSDFLKSLRPTPKRSTRVVACEAAVRFLTGDGDLSCSNGSLESTKKLPRRQLDSGKSLGRRKNPLGGNRE